MSQKFKSDIETQAGLIDSFGSTGIAGQVLSSTGTKTEWITPPQSPGGGGSSQVFYFNGGTVSSVGGYYQMSPVANTGTAADFTINANGYIASFLTDVASPNQLNIPAGNWNFEIYFSASSSGGSPSFYVELYKYSSGGVFTLIASSSAAPEGITNGTTLDAYFTPLAVPTTTLLATDRLAVRVYVTHSGRTITMHTQNGHLSEVITTFSTGLTALNGLTEQVQYFSTGTAGTDFNIASAVNTHTFNLPTASATNRGALSSADWITFNSKANASGTTNYVSKFTGSTSLGNSQIFDNGTNVGIGTASPSAKLDVSSGNINLSNSFNLTGRNNANTLNIALIGRSSTDRVIIDADGYGTNIGGGGSVLINQNGGNVGIGTTSPGGLGEKLTVIGSINSNNTALFFGDGADNSASIYSTAGPIKFLANASERMRITSAGNVGIGTTSPSGLLHLYKNNSPVVFRLQSASPYAYPGDFSIQTGGYGSNDFIIYDNTASAERLYINSSGNVGIGTTSPAAKLDVSVGQEVNGYSLAGYPFLKYSSGDVLDYGAFGNTWQALRFLTNGSERMRVTSAGNVGIGTTSPTYKLDVLGDIGAYANGDNNGFIGTAGGTHILSLTRSTNNVKLAGYDGVVFYTNATTLSGGSERMRIASNGAIKFNAYGSGSFTGTATQRLAVDSSGNVIEIPIGGGAVDGSGTTNYVTKWTDADTIGNSQIFDNGANVGIGTNLPQATLQVGNGAGVKAIYVTGSGTNLGLGGLSVSFLGFATGTISTVNTSGAVPLGVGTRSTQPLVLGTNNAERMRIDSSGNVGIGTSSPLGPLEVYRGNSGGLGGHIIINNNGLAVGSSTALMFGDGPIDGIRGAISTTTEDNPYYGQMDFKTGAGTYGNLFTRMTIKGNGNIGIGTTNPNRLLTVSGTTSGLIALNASSYRNTTIGSDSVGNFVVYDDTEGAYRMVINSSGNVGIGTTSPSVNLQVTNTSGELFRLTNTTGAERLHFYTRNSASNSRIGSQNSSLQLFSEDVGFDLILGTSNTERMRIANNGNVGIGTSAPATKFDVQLASNKHILFHNGNGEAEILGATDGGSAYAPLFISASPLVLNINNGSNVGIGTANPFGILTIKQGAAQLDVFTSSDAIVLEGIDRATTSNPVDIRSYARNGNHVWYTGSYSERMRITSGGNVGIGTTNPLSLLNVQGSGYFPSKLITLSGAEPNRYNANIGTNIINGNSIGLSFGTRSNNVDYDNTLNLWNGNVGIGTTSPQAKLHIITDTNYAAIFNTSIISSSSTAISIGGHITAPGGQGGSIGIRGYHNHSGTAQSSMAFEVNGQEEKMRITSGGNVGINTTAPIHKLSVNGKIGGDVWSAGYIEFLSTTETVISAESNVVLGYAQNVVVDNEGSVGVGTIAPEACAALEIKSTTQGFLLPRMRTGERDSIGSPVAGLMIFNTDDEIVQVYTNGSGWRTLAFL